MSRISSVIDALRDIESVIYERLPDCPEREEYRLLLIAEGLSPAIYGTEEQAAQALELLEITKTSLMSGEITRENISEIINITLTFSGRNDRTMFLIASGNNLH